MCSTTTLSLIHISSSGWFALLLCVTQVLVAPLAFYAVSYTHLDVYKRQASHPNRVYTRDQLLDEVWGFEYYGDSRTIDVHVKRLREKLAGASDKWELKTVWGVGYKFEVRQ